MHGSSPERPPGPDGPDSPHRGRLIGEADVDVWLLAAPEDAGAERVARCAALLDAGERARLARFRAPADRARYLFAHALVRATLSRYAPETPPAAWRFHVGPHGRPEIADELVRGGAAMGAALAPPLRFNLSHTAGLVACAVALGRDVGVDVEHTATPRFDAQACLEVAASSFAPSELAGLAGLPPEARRERFFAIWTLKEAYIKARGLGLALPLASFAFELGADGPDGAAPAIDLRFAPELEDDAARWHLARLQPTPAHALAVAARRAPDETLNVRVCEAQADSP
jgi:4'-phosphopantetheinyl transferase